MAISEKDIKMPQIYLVDFPAHSSDSKVVDRTFPPKFAAFSI